MLRRNWRILLAFVAGLAAFSLMAAALIANLQPGDSDAISCSGQTLAWSQTNATSGTATCEGSASVYGWGFDDGTTDGWALDYGPATVAWSSNAYDQSGSLGVAIANANNEVGVKSPVFTGINPGASISAWVYAPNSTQQVSVKPYSSDSTLAYTFGPLTKLAAGWQQITWTIPTTVADVHYIGIAFANPDPSVDAGNYNIDTVQVANPTTTATPTPTTTTASPTPTSTPTTATPTPTTTTASPTTTASCPSNAPTGEGTTAAATLGWGTPVAGDEFNYTGAPDSTKWNVYVGAGNAGQGQRVASANSVGCGMLTITGDASGNTGGMGSTFGQKYGRWETRMMVSQRIPEYHPVSIVWPDNDASTTCQEIDYAEGWGGDLSHMEFNLHPSCSNTVSSSNNYSGVAWHNYAVDWEPGSITGYVDGVQYFSDTNASDLAAISLSSHQTLQLDWFPDSGTTTTTQMFVDWTRYYAPASSSSPTPTTTTTPTPTPTTTSTPTPTPTPTTTTSSPAPSGAPHVMVIPLENHSYSQVIGNSSYPYINSLATQYRSATQSYGVGHWSLDNYLAIASGQWYAWSDGDCSAGSGCEVGDPNIFTQFDSAGIPWKAYMQGMSGPCSWSGTSYAVRHNPVPYFTSIPYSECQAKDVPDTNMISDLNSATPPDFVWYTPNLCNDGHDCSLTTSDSWLSQEIPAIQATSWYKNGGVIILTTDEGDASGQGQGEWTSGEGNHITTIAISAADSGAGQFTPYFDHWGLTGGIETEYGLPCLANACSLSQWGQFPVR